VRVQRICLVYETFLIVLIIIIIIIIIIIDDDVVVVWRQARLDGIMNFLRDWWQRIRSSMLEIQEVFQSVQMIRVANPASYSVGT